MGCLPALEKEGVSLWNVHVLRCLLDVASLPINEAHPRYRLLLQDNSLK